MSDLIDARVLRAPNDLAVTPLTPKRVLIVGSCLSEGWANRMKRLPEPCASDVYLLGRDLPENPERPIEEYDFQIVQLALRFVLPDSSFARLGQMDIEGHEKLFTHAVNGMRRFLTGAMKWNVAHGILTFVFPFVVPMQNAVGRLMPRYDIRNPVYFIEKLNEELAKDLAAYKNTYFFDLNEVHCFYGRRYMQEDYYSSINHGGYLSNFDFNHDQNRLEASKKATDLYEERVNPVFLAGWNELVAMYRSARQIDMVKMVVIDLDDTLWRGVIAELEIDALPSSEGWVKGFWETLSFLKRRGVLLAICSKNEESRVELFWNKILGRHMSLDDFAIRRINWRPKPENMAEILAHVNLLPRNVVYIDDNPAERAAMQGAFPDIRVLGGTPLAWRRILLWAPETQVPEITPESAARTDMVRAQVVREEQRQVLSREEFLATLNVKMALFEIGDADHPRFGRVLELINKTNQFNTTGTRWTREDCIAEFAGGTAFYAFDVADAYTEYGLVGVLVVGREGIKQFVMSCRIMGLEAELAAVACIYNLFRDSGVGTMFCGMVETDRNLPCRDVYSRCNFSAVEGGWQRSTSSPMPLPAHISLDGPTGFVSAITHAPAKAVA
jgi:FkbH-like protein